MLVNLFTYLLYINCYAMKKEGRYFFDIFAILTKPRVSWIKPRRKSSTNTSPTPLIAIEDESVDESVDKYVITREEEVNIAIKFPFSNLPYYYFLPFPLPSPLPFSYVFFLSLLPSLLSLLLAS